MNDVRDGYINCIVVKDLSRFGRNYVEVGDYIEKIFPFLGVRFISVVDHYDSEDPNCNKDRLLMSIKNLMHEMYARDISKKIHSAIKVKQKSGSFIRTTKVPYGYKMGESEYKYVADEKSAKVVRDIFSLYLGGESIYAICKYLNENMFSTPSEYERTKKVYRNTTNETTKYWLQSTVTRIIENEVYVGNLIRHCSEQAYYKNLKSQKIDEENWIRINNMHEAIIEQEVFEEVRKMRSERKGANPRDILVSDERKCYQYEENIFSGFIYCGHCKNPMQRVNLKRVRNGVSYVHKGFACALHTKYIDSCISKERIDEDLLCEMLSDLIAKQVKLYKNVLKMIKDYNCSSSSSLSKSFQSEINMLSKKISECDRNILNLLEQYHLDKISKSQVIELKSNILNDKESYINNKKIAERKMKRLEKAEIAINKVMKSWLYKNGNRISKEIIETYVDRIDIYMGKRIEVKLKYQDEFKELALFLEEGQGVM